MVEILSIKLILTGYYYEDGRVSLIRTWSILVPAGNHHHPIVAISISFCTTCRTMLFREIGHFALFAQPLSLAIPSKPSLCARKEVGVDTTTRPCYPLSSSALLRVVSPAGSASDNAPCPNCLSRWNSLDRHPFLDG